MRLEKSTTRRGSTLTELIVAGTLLIAGLGLFSRGTFGLGYVRQDTRHYQLALDELANQLERLTALDVASRQAALTELQPSESILASVPGMRMTGEMLNDQDGERIVLTANWDRKGPAQPLSLVSWIHPVAQGVRP